MKLQVRDKILIIIVAVFFLTIGVNTLIRELSNYSFVVVFVSLGLAVVLLLSSLSINKMTEDLQKTTTSADSLNWEIAERKKAEAALRKSEERFKAVAESAGDWIWEVNTEGLYTYSNPVVEKVLGYKPEEIVGKKYFYDFFAPDVKEELKKAAFEAFARGESFRGFVNPNVHKDGSIVILETTGTPIVDDKGNLCGYRGARDVTERKKVEEALKESEQRLTIILNSILTGVVIIDAQTREIVDCNPLAAKIIGLPREGIIGKVCHKFICPAEKGKCPISDLGQVVDHAERVLIQGNGEETPILKKVTPVFWQGHQYLVESFIDITERKGAEQRQGQLLEEVEKVNRELKDFAYIVSHDLKAPLRGIKTLAEWLTTDYSDKLDENGKEQMNLLIGRVNRMQNLIDGILQYSRIGRVKEDIVQINLNEIVSEVADTVSPPANISITIENELPTVECERTCITQVFQNLISNAVKYMDKSQGQIKIGCVEEDGRWKFSVSDNGPGIEEKYFEKIFQIFQTLARRDDKESTGVGLSIVKKIIEARGGKVWVESKVGEGSTFYFIVLKNVGAETNEELEAHLVSGR
jgi:two-component system, LuxR family, sensor kinase FixL